MSAELPVSSLLQAQLAYSRHDFGPMEDLIADVKKHGVREPLLIMPDYLMVDGARRLVAADKAGQRYVPVIFCHTWERFTENYKPWAETAYPMTWVELNSLVNNVLRPLYQEYRYRIAAITKDQRRAAGLPAIGNGPRENNYSFFITELSEVFNCLPTHVKMLFDQMRRLTRLGQENPALLRAFTAAIQGFDLAERRDLSHLRVLKTTLDAFEREERGVDDAAVLLTERVRALSQSGGRFKERRRRRDVIDHDAPVIGAPVLEKFAALLLDIGRRADDFRNFKPHTRHQIQVALDAYDAAVTVGTQLYRLRRRLEAVLPDDIPGVEDKEPLDG